MGEQFIQLGPDSAGDKQRTRQRTVSAQTVEELFVINQSQRVSTGRYNTTVQANIVQTAHVNTSPPGGFAWIYNPVGSSIIVGIISVEFMSQMIASQSMPASPRIVLQRFTLSANSDAPANGAKIDSSSATSVGLVETGNADATFGVTLGAEVFAFLSVASATNTITNYTWAATSDWCPDESGRLMLRAGEGMAVRQPDAGKQNPQGDDTLRQFKADIQWNEFTIP